MSVLDDAALFAQGVSITNRRGAMRRTIHMSNSGNSVPVIEHRCANGLTALLLPTETTPVVCISVWYRAGARHDPTGKSGTAHLLEHMMFKGTARHPKGAYDQVLHALGGMNNASTWMDRTNYYILIGSDRYAAALELEADRMAGALLTEEDLDDERPVVLNELDQSKDDPGAALFDRLLEQAFPTHPYRRPVIGWRADVESITAGDLRAFYDRYYRPANAFLTIVGLFEPVEMIAAIEEHFGRLPAGPAPPPPRERETPQRAERRFELRRAGEQDIIGMAYHAPQRARDESFAMDVLAQVLGHGRTSRLYKALVDTELAVGVVAENQSIPVDPFLFLMDIEPADGVSVVQIESVLAAELDRLTKEPISTREMERARKRARVDFIMRRDSVSAMAFMLGELEISTGWRFAETYLGRLADVTSARVMEAARRYLSPAGRTLGHFRPIRGSEGEGES